MTSPAITTHPDAPLPAAARLMSSRHIKRLPVVEAGTAFGGGVGGKLIGIVSRCDLLSVFLRPDEDIARAVREMLAQLPQADPGGVTVAVRNGIVTLAGLLGSAEEHDLIQVAGRVAGVLAFSWTFLLCCFWCRIVKLPLVIRWAYLAEPTLFPDVIVISLDVVEHGGPDLARVAPHVLIDQLLLDRRIKRFRRRVVVAYARCARPTG